jgi:hypothetical protein
MSQDAFIELRKNLHNLIDYGQFTKENKNGIILARGVTGYLYSLLVLEKQIQKLPQYLDKQKAK